MQLTNIDGTIRRKPFAWSYSRLKNFEVCPKRHYDIDLRPKGDPNKIIEPKNETLLWGDYVHESLAKRCGSSRSALPADLQIYEKWAAKVIGNGSPHSITVEQSMTLTENFAPAKDNFAPDVWFRCKVDFLRLEGDIALLVDWKTGKILEDSVQLALSAAAAFAKYPELKAIKCVYVWLAEDCESSETFMRSDLPTIWRNVWPRIMQLKTAHDEQNYPPKPSGMCVRFCPVKACPYNGKGSR
jgi:hypothetical protein